MALTKVPSNLDATIATTQSQADNSTNIATTAYVDLAISNLSDSAPAALNTLNEIAAALGDDANYASTTTAAIAAKLPLAGGTMTGALAMNTNAITSTGDLTLDAAGDIILDADGDDWKFKNGGLTTLEIKHESSSVDFLLNATNDDFKFKGSDDGSTITALQLDMSEAGAATFNSTVISPLIDATIVDGENFKIAGAQGSDGQVLTSTGSGVAWEAAVSSFAALSDTVVSTSNPATNTNPSSGVGTLWLNRSAGELYVLSDATTNANVWLNLVDSLGTQIGGLPTGGTESTAGGYTYHAFTSSGTMTYTAAKTGVDVLIVAGGGGGGGRYNSGGGGAGGMLEYTNQTFNGNHTVTVGAGGAGGAHDSRGTQGGSSSISGPSGSWTTAVGGGGGGGWNANGEGGDGGSGGGASGYQTGNTSQGSGTSGQGTSGGRGASYGGGGGGGKTATSNPTGGGQNGTNTQGGDGGPGKQWLNGTTYAGGGGGSDYGTSGGQGVGGAGGGGTGGSHGNGNINGAGTLEATDGTANTGGGGGGASGYGAANDTSPMAIGGNGGSGIVIFRYAT
jgi:hypothetical protein